MRGARPRAGFRRRRGLERRLARALRRDAPAPSEVLDGPVQVLVRWSASWERPVAVVAMPSRRFPLLVGSLAEHVASRLTKPTFT